MNDHTNTATDTTEPKLTAREKLLAKYNKLSEKAAALTAEVNEIVASINAIDALASIAEGTPVIVSIGKGETARDVEGVVIGVKEEDDGSKVYKVQYGTGFDADIAVVKAGRIALAPVAESVAE